MEYVKRECGFDSMFAVDRDGNSGGIALLWKAQSSVSLLTFSKYLIDVVVQDQSGGRSWQLTGIYGEPDQGKRREFWMNMTALKERSDLP